MTIQFKLSTLAIACSLALTACGSSGGHGPSILSSNTPKQHHSSQNTPPKAEETVKPTETPTPPTPPTPPEAKAEENQPEMPAQPDEKPKVDEPVQPSQPDEKPKVDKPMQPSTPAKAGSAFGGDNDKHQMLQAIDGGVMVHEGGISDPSNFSAPVAPTSNSQDMVLLNGKPLYTAQLEDDEFTADEVTWDEDTDQQLGIVIHSGNLLPDVRYGAVADISNIQNIRQALFVQGSPAKSDTIAAQQGTATFKGTGLHFGKSSNEATAGTPFITNSIGFAGSGEAYDLNHNGRATDVTADVDFSKKTIDVAISNPEQDSTNGVRSADLKESLAFKGEIKGNTFSSEDQHLQGGFYGQQADQLAGMYTSSADPKSDEYYSGVFGAKKTEASDSQAAAPAKPEMPSDTDNHVAENSAIQASTQYIVDKAAKDFNLATANSFKDLHTIVINGIEIHLPDQSTDKLAEANNYRVFNNLQDVVYGAVNANGQQALFIQGNLTDVKTITDQIARYTGDVLHYRARVLNDDTDPTHGMLVGGDVVYTTNGTFNAEADFGKKSLAVKIDSGDRNYMGTQTFNATINGNTFNSNSKTHAIAGGFYGANAAAIAGKYSYSDGDTSRYSNSAFGVFGGKKVK